MGLHYELVISVHLRNALSDADLAEVMWHLGLGPVPDRPHMRDAPLFGPEEDGYLPGGDLTRLREERKAGRDGSSSKWGLFVRRYMLDDTLYELISPLCDWLAEVALDGYAGYWREEDATVLSVLIVRQGHTYMSTQSGDVKPATFGAPPWTAE